MPDYIPVEYDPFAPVPVDHDPWDGHPDPFAYPARDQVLVPEDRPAQHSFGEKLHPNATGIFVDPNKPPPAGDEVLYPESSSYTDPRYVMPSTSRGLGGGYTIDTPMPGVSVNQDTRERGVLRNLEQGGNYDPQYDAMRISDRRYLDLTPRALPLTPDEQDVYAQRYPLPGDMQPPPSSPGPPQAWFERPSWLQAETPEGYTQPYPSPSGLSGGYSGHGKMLGKQSPLRGTYRHTWEF